MESLAGHHQYDHSKSTTYIPNGRKFSIDYGIKGSSGVEGFLSQDVVTVSLIRYSFDIITLLLYSD